MTSLIIGDHLKHLALRRPLQPLLRWRGQDNAAASGCDEVTFVKSSAEIPAELWNTAFAPPLEGRWLYESLEQSGMEHQFSLFYALLSHRGLPAGIAPVFLMDVPMERVTPAKLLKTLRVMGRLLPSILYQRTLFVGCPCGEGAIGFLPGADRRALLLALQDGLIDKARELGAELIAWKDMSPSLSADLDWLSTRRRLFRVTGLPSTIVKFASRQKDDYFRNLKPSRRYALKKKLRLSASEVEVLVEVLNRPEPKVLDEVFALFWKTYIKAKTKFEEMNRAWFAKAADLDTAFFVILREKQTGSMVAFMLCFACGSHLINKFVGFDYTKPKSWMLYFRLWDAVVEWALSQGFRSIQSGQNTYRAKIEIGHELVPIFDYLRHRNFLIHVISRWIVRSLDWAKLDGELALYLKAHPETNKMPRLARADPSS